MKKNAETRDQANQDGYRQRAACVCINKSRPDCTVLVSSTRNKLFWVIPGGGVEFEETFQDAALRELEEEAGLKGSIIKSIGIFNNEDRKHRTEVFLVDVNEELDKWQESDQRKRVWMNFDEANRLLSLYKPYQCEYLAKFRNSSGHSTEKNNQKVLNNSN